MISRLSKKAYASNMKHRIVIQHKIPTSDGEGGFNDEWVDISTVWASINPIRADQRFEYQSVNVDATHRINIRGEGIPLEDDIQFAGQAWTITWSGVPGVNVSLDYRIDEGSWVSISASEPNTGSYAWTIPLTLINQRITVRISEI